MTLVTHFKMELHRVDVKTAFMTVSYLKNYLFQTECFEIKGKEHIVCRLNKSLHGLKQASRQWILKFDEGVTSFGLNKPQDNGS